jgi:peptide/nickel transport system substrate-binding protein
MRSRTCLAAQDVPVFKAWGEVTADLLKRLGMNVDLAAIDWGTAVARTAQKSPPGQGGWQIHLFWTSAGVSAMNPANGLIRANGAFFGWPNSPQVEAEVAAWFEANPFEAEKAALRRLNKAAFDHVVYAPLGFFLGYQAWRKNVSGIVKGPLPFFWGVSKTA